jgi:hypothetical protein
MLIGFDSLRRDLCAVCHPATAGTCKSKHMVKQQMQKDSCKKE